MLLPKARTGGIVVQPLGKELLIYDLETHRAFNLNETSATVFNHCDGATTFADLNRKYQYTDDLIHLALDTLCDENLLSEQGARNFPGLTRREAIRRVGLSTLVALPVVSSLVAPTAAQAQSAAPLLANGAVCGASNQCASNRCGQLGFGPTCCSADDFQACVTSNDCCSGVACTNNVCCQGAGRVCDTRSSNQCCAGLTCVAPAGFTNGSCQ